MIKLMYLVPFIGIKELVVITQDVEVLYILKCVRGEYVYVYFKTRQDRAMTMNRCHRRDACYIIEAGVMSLQQAIIKFEQYTGSRENDPRDLFPELLAQVEASPS